MYNLIYALPLDWYAVFAIAALFIWTAVPRLLDEEPRVLRLWRILNGLLCPMFLYLVFWMAVLRRSPGNSERKLLLELFQSIRLRFIQPEQVRLIMLNILVFLPVGLTFSATLPERLHKAARMGLTVAVCMLVSVLIEALQYHYALGTTELDDVIYNTFGGVLGTLPVLFTPARRASDA